MAAEVAEEAIHVVSTQGTQGRVWIYQTQVVFSNVGDLEEGLYRLVLSAQNSTPILAYNAMSPVYLLALY